MAGTEQVGRNSNDLANIHLLEITTDIDSAFFLSVLHTRSDYLVALCNSFINFCCDYSSEFRLKIEPGFEIPKLFQIEAVEIHRAWNLLSENDPFEFFTSLMVERIQKGFSIIGCSDGYFFSEAPFSLLDHKCVSFHIIGESNGFFDAIWSDMIGELKLYRISRYDFLNSIRSMSDSPFFASFIKNNNIALSIDYQAIASSIEKLIEYGFSLAKEKLEVSEGYCYIRNCRVVLEHATLMIERISYLSVICPELRCVSSDIDIIKKVANELSFEFTNKSKSFLNSKLFTLIDLETNTLNKISLIILEYSNC